MAGPVQESLPQEQTNNNKRCADADPEPSPVTKRPAEDTEHKQKAQNPETAAAAPQQQQTADQSGEAKTAQEPAVPSTENGKPEVPSTENGTSAVQSTGDGKPAAEHAPVSAETNAGEVPSGQSEAQNGEVKTEVQTAAVASQLAAEAAAAQAEAQKVANIAAQKQAEAVEALQAVAKEAPVDQNTAKPVVNDTSETNPTVPQESGKPTGADSSSEPQAKDAEPQAPAQPAEQKMTEAGPENGPEAAMKVTPFAATPVEAPLQKPAPAPDTVFPPPTASLTPANPLPQTASTPLIGNIPPQAVESLKVAAQQAASLLPVQPTQEFLEQQGSTRTTCLTEPVDQGVAPMEE